MALLNRRTPDYFLRRVSDEMRSAGFSTRGRDDDIGLAIGAVIAEMLGLSYAEIYEVADNLLPTEATGLYQDRYGEMLGVSKYTTGYAKDLSLTNTWIGISTKESAGTYTIDNGPIVIPRGTQIYDESLSISATIVNSPIIRHDKARGFAQVVINDPTLSNVPAGTFTTISYKIRTVPNIDPNRISTDIYFTCGNDRGITAPKTEFSDNDFRYIITKLSEGLGGGNRASLDGRIIQIPGVARYTIMEHTHGNGSVTVFVEAEDLTFPTAIMQAAEVSVKKALGHGTRVIVTQPVLVPVKVVIEVTGNPTQDQMEGVIRGLQAQINDTPAGKTLSLSDLNAFVTPTMPLSKVTKIYKDGREVKESIPVRWNQKLVMNEPNSVVFV